jgi:hypothetical protein
MSDDAEAPPRPAAEVNDFRDTAGIRTETLKKGMITIHSRGVAMVPY